MYDVSGDVSFDGQPVEDGYIKFAPDDKTLGPDAVPIKGGKYSGKVKGGKHKVEITAVRETGKTLPGPNGPEPEKAGYIPEKYNANTTLTAEVGPGNTKHDFPLKK